MEVEAADAMDDVSPDVVMAPPQRAAKPFAVRSDRSVARDIERDDDVAVREWMDSLVAGDTAIKVSIKRKRPMISRTGENIGGLLETVDDKIDEEYIRDTWGGGEFQLIVQTPQANGKWKILRHRSIKIAGPPKMSGEVAGAGPAAAAVPVGGADDSLAERAFNSMERAAKDERERADRIERERGSNGRFDVAALSAMNAPLMEQLRVAQDQARDLSNRVLELTTRPPPRDDFRDKLLERAISDESARIEALRSQYESRMDKLRDSHDDQIKRMEDRYTSDIKRLEDRHTDEIRRLEARQERELKGMERQAETQVKNQDTAHGAKLTALESENKRLERDLGAALAKIAALEAKKDQSISEKADEIMKVQEALESLTGGKNEGKDEKWYEKIIDLAGNSEVAMRLVDKLGGGPSQQNGVGEQPQLPPPGVPFANGDGNIYVRDAAGNVSIVPPQALQAGRQPQRRKRRNAAVAGAAPAGVEPTDADDEDQDVVEQIAPVRPPKPDEVKMAVLFMENAMKGGKSPEDFARGARALVPGDVLAFIQRVGIDAFLDKVVEPGSALATVRGRQFARAVAKILVQGAADPVELVQVAVSAPEDGEDGEA